ncbi:pilin N-terminal domain-containing protein [Lacticaseibacillus paracasei]|uniref:pilin N-terminal domain-containing protein n=1 Tax=Lacticaseibacillus paracasei TaxID=1597 RepID=UPI00234B7346|nr:pilin N-terminal domain-containing protein [Lacticaseibacillus paracasei]MDC6273835.1 pilin N-terminal domain-containing protein [Lacticaseibacillus paracasei]MDN4553970.1 pilin N-terminal domain-containing protein [Lacticaseibacillus paracasei]
MRLRLLWWVIPLLLLVGTLLGLQPVSAAENTAEIVLHKRIYRDVRQPEDVWYDNDGQIIDPENPDKAGYKLLSKTSGLNGANFEVYDASSLLKSDMTPDDVQALIEKYQNMTRKQALKFARANLQLAGQGNKGLGLINTTTDKNLGEDGIGRVTVDTGQGSFEKAYLLIETALDFSTDLNVDMERKSSPMLIVFPVKDPTSGDPMSTVHLYLKNVGYVRDPYFFKFGVHPDGTSRRLAGAIFAIYRIVDGQKLYLDLSPATDLKNKWVASTDALHDDRVNKFVSDKDGLVNTGERFLSAGTYYFEELQSVPGYELDEKSRAIKIEIPDSWLDDDDNYRYVLIDGQPMKENIGGIVTPEMISIGNPRVYNYTDRSSTSSESDPTTPTSQSDQSDKPTGAGATGYLPAMSDWQNLSLVLIGVGLLTLATYFLIKHKKARNHP